MNQDELQNTVLCGDALEMLKRLPDEYVQMCVTSPPYYGLRDYGAEGQIGCEQTPLEYIDRLTEIFREVRRVLKSNGTLWLNIADSYAGSGKGVWSKSLAERPKSKQTYHSLNTDENAALPKKWDGIKEKDMIGIPWQLAFALRADGWYLRSDIIWQKPNCLPEAVKDRQFIFSVLACGVAVGVYFLLKPHFGTETVSWMCILAAAPFAALGFIKYNGMTAEKFVWAWIKSEFLLPKKLVFRSTNTYFELMRPGMELKKKEVLKAND